MASQSLEVPLQTSCKRPIKFQGIERQWLSEKRLYKTLHVEYVGGEVFLQPFRFVLPTRAEQIIIILLSLVAPSSWPTAGGWKSSETIWQYLGHSFHEISSHHPNALHIRKINPK